MKSDNMRVSLYDSVQNSAQESVWYNVMSHIRVCVMYSGWTSVLGSVRAGVYAGTLARVRVAGRSAADIVHDSVRNTWSNLNEQ